METSERNTWALFIHLSALSGLIGVPFGHIVGPLILWLIKKETEPDLDLHGREALNFQISSMIYAAVSAVLMLVLIGFILLPLVLLGNLILTILATIKASKGEHFEYPLTIKFL